MQRLTPASNRRKTGSKARPAIGALAIVALVAAGLVATTAAGAQTGDSTGVTAKDIKVGYIFSQTGVAGSTFAHVGDGFNARIKAENAKGGVNGRKITAVTVDDGGTTNNLQASKSLVENDNVFAVVNNSSFAFLSYRYLLGAGVPMVGGGYDGNEYGQPGNEKLISILGNIAPVYGAQYTPGFCS